jgi:hypothetical protein
MVNDSQSLELREIYQQQYAHFGRMNETLYKMPPIFATIIGGLWYFGAAYLNSDKVISAGVFLFTAFSGGCFIIALKRFSLAFSRYIDNINKMDGDMKVTLRDSAWPSTISVMMALIIVTIVISLGGVLYAVVK